MAGTIPSIPLSQQFTATNPPQPMAGAQLYFFQVGTVGSPQNSYEDFGLTILNPNPLPADNFGRIPMFYLADGQVHVRLTDASGVVVFDYPSMQVIGPSTGGGGGGSVDPTTVFSSGDVKWRGTSEVLTGWVKANGMTIGSPTSGATQRANADTQNLYVYLWDEYSNTVCPVAGGRTSALNDFQSNKTIGLPDWRGRVLTGLDDMGNSPAGIIPGGTTPAATGGEASHMLLVAEMASGLVTLTQTPHTHAPNSPNTGYVEFGAGSAGTVAGSNYPVVPTTASANANITLTDNGGNGVHNNLQPYVLGTIYMKL